MSSHPDADAFMRKCLEEPTEATTRLVFADWLEETGEAHNAAWAHFIRLKADAARYTLNSYERPELERQADEYAPKIRAQLTIPAKIFVGYPKSLLQLLPPPNIVVRLADFEIPLAVLELMPESVARENLVLPLAMQGRTMLAAMPDPHNTDLADKLDFILNRTIVLVRAEREDVQETLDRHYDPFATVYVGSGGYYFPNFPELLPANGSADDELITDRDSPIVRLVNSIFTEAIHLHADRIQIFPDPGSVAVRYRIDSEWVERDRMPARLLTPVTRQVAIAAGIYIGRVFGEPQPTDPLLGEIPLQVHNTHFRVRVTIQPSPDGPATQIDFLREPRPSF